MGRLDLIFIFSVIVIWVFVDLVLKKKFGLPRQKEGFFQSGLSKKEVYFYISLTLVVFCLLYFWIQALDAYYVLIPLLMSGLFGYRAFKQYRQDKSTKQFVRTMVDSIAFFVLFIGIVVMSYPREIHHTYEAVMVSGDTNQEEHVTIEIQGETWLNLLYGKSFFGTLQVGDSEFLVLQYWEEPRETPIIDRLKGTYRQYTMIETEGNKRGKVWLSRDFASFVGSFSATKFAHPAKTVDEAENLFKVISHQ